VKAKLYLDEDVLPALARMLRQRGYDVVSAHELGRQGLSDEDHLAFATNQGCVLVSYNVRDYRRLALQWFAFRRDHAGIILGYRQFSRDKLGNIARALARFIDLIPAENMVNIVRYIEEFLI